MNTAVRPLVLPGQHALDSLAERLTHALGTWIERWSSQAAAALAVDATAAEKLPTGAMLEIIGNSGRLWRSATTDDRLALQRAVFGEQTQASDVASDPWALCLLEDATVDLDHCLAECLVGGFISTVARNPPTDLLAFGAGTIRLTCPHLGLDLLADASAFQHVPPRPRAKNEPRPVSLTPLLSRARQAMVPITVEIGRIELDLARLLDLQPGDVLRLPTRLTDALTLSIEGHEIAKAALGHLGNHRAVQLASL